jgi:Domain of unknown function (DUF4389)
MSAYYAAPGAEPTAVTGQEELAPVLIAFAGPAAQSRLTVLIRLLMAIPHLIVLWALTIAAYVIVIIGWFAALFTGRLPAFAADYLAGFVRWQTRVFGYVILLTDAYPPFTLEDADYPIRVAVRPGRLNRLAVLFRFFLLIPAWIVQAVVSYGAFTIVQFVSWLIVLITGRMPDALYQALAAVLRFQTRVLGFTLMLTSVYPFGLYGDAQPDGSTGAEPGYGDPQGWATQAPGDPQGGATQEPGDPEAGATQQLEYGQLPAYGQAGYGQAGYGASAAGTGATSWWLVLSGAAKKLVTVFIVLGVLFAIGQGVVQATVTGKALTAAEARSRLQTDLNPLNATLSSYSSQVQACQTNACVSALNHSLAGAFSTFASQVGDIKMPSGQASANAATLASASSHVASIYAALAKATSASQSQSIAAGLPQAVAQINSDYTALGNDLSSS